MSNLIEVFIQKDAMQFEAKKINEALRGRIFLFTDALLTKQPEKYQVEDIKAYLKYLCKYLGFGRFYLGKYQKSFPSVNIPTLHRFYWLSLLKEDRTQRLLSQNLMLHMHILFLNYYFPSLQSLGKGKGASDFMNLLTQ